MDINAILTRLEHDDRHYPKEAIREAIAHRDEIIPSLLDILKTVAHDPQGFADDPKRMSHIYAMYLLAQFRETRAYPLLVEIFSTPGETPMDLAGDVVTEDLGRIVASVSDGDMSGITQLVENKEANEFVRSAALTGMVTLVACGKRSRDEVTDYFRRLFRTMDRTPNLAWSSLASRCKELCPEEVKDDLRLAFRDGLIESFHIRWENIERALRAGKEAAMKEIKERYRLIDDVEEEISWWACFEENKRKWDSAELHLPRSPVAKPKVKVGRNEPCPCGSGKKFKRCCGR